MSTHTFPIGANPRVIVTGCQGELAIDAWGERSITIEADDLARVVGQEETALIIHDARGDLRLQVPADTVITAENHDGDVTVHGVGGLVLGHIEGELRITSIAGSVRLRDIYGSTIVDGAESLVIERDEPLRDKRRLLDRVRREVEVHNVGMIEIAEVSDNLSIVTAQYADVGEVGGKASAHAIAGDLHFGAVGGGCEASRVGGNLEIGSVGGSCAVEDVAGGVSVREIGGNADFRAVGAVQQLGNVGGSLTLTDAVLAPASPSEGPDRITVGGNARIELPNQPNLTINAIVGGTINGASSFGFGGIRTIVYGDGAAQLKLTVGGNLDLHRMGAAVTG